MKRGGLGVLIALCACVAAAGRTVVAQDANDWRVGADVGLSKGTCIREGPGLGYPAHTTVPEDNWTVRVIGGPRGENDLTWFDTSRNAAGDPSGGTGWVAREQSDRDCPQAGGGGNGDDVRRKADDWLARLRRWWNAQNDTMRWIVVIVALVAIVFAWNQTSSMLLPLIGAAIMGAILWWLTDAVRNVWQTWWWGVVGRGGPDLALIVGLLPIVSTFVRALTARSRRR